jgi:hypothetical protein
MAKTATLTGNDLAPAKVRPQGAARQRGVTASSEYVPLQFRMPPDAVKQFKREALELDMKYNEFLLFLLSSFQENKSKAGQAKR